MTSISREKLVTSFSISKMTAEVLNIGEFLSSRQAKGKNFFGKCNKCGVQVEWRRNRVHNHMERCEKASPEDRALFKKRKLDDGNDGA